MTALCLILTSRAEKSSTDDGAAASVTNVHSALAHLATDALRTLVTLIVSLVLLLDNENPHRADEIDGVAALSACAITFCVIAWVAVEIHSDLRRSEAGGSADHGARQNDPS